MLVPILRYYFETIGVEGWALGIRGDSRFILGELPPEMIVFVLLDKVGMFELNIEEHSSIDGYSILELSFPPKRAEPR